LGNEENEYPVPDPDRMMINITNEFKDVHKKNLSKRKLWMSSLNYSWKSCKRWLNKMYRINSSNIKTPQIKNLRRHRIN
jgi:hypothetical protein